MERLPPPFIPLPNNEAFTVLGLSAAERKVIIALWGMAKTLPMISRATRITRTTLPYMLRKLEGRGLIKRMREPETTYWKGNMQRSIKRIQQLLC